MSNFGRHLQNVGMAAGIGEPAVPEFRNRYSGAHKIVTGSRFRSTKEELRNVRALGAWRALNAGKLVPTAAAGVQRDYAEEFKKFAKDPSLLRK